MNISNDCTQSVSKYYMICLRASDCGVEVVAGTVWFASL